MQAHILPMSLAKVLHEAVPYIEAISLVEAPHTLEVGYRRRKASTDLL